MDYWLELEQVVGVNVGGERSAGSLSGQRPARRRVGVYESL